MRLTSEFNGKVTTVTIGELMVTFSYETVIGVSDSQEHITHENIWGTTTGKHLNSLDGGSKEAKAARLGSEDFEKRQAAILKRHKL